MLTAIQFNYNALFKADEIYDKVLDWLLSSEFYSFESLCSKISPENPFARVEFLGSVLANPVSVPPTYRSSPAHSLIACVIFSPIFTPLIRYNATTRFSLCQSQTAGGPEDDQEGIRRESLTLRLIMLA